MDAPLAAPFYNRPPEVAARALLGRIVIRALDGIVTAGRIVETEAYLAAGDSACHAARGLTRKNAAMFGPPGRAYVYPIHARWCFNVVTQPEGVASAVLIRALEPLEGIEWMQARRGCDTVRDAARGPARLCQALAIERGLNHWDLTQGETLWLTGRRGLRKSEAVAITPRIGVTSAQDLLLRFAIRGNPYVSGPRRLRAEA